MAPKKTENSKCIFCTRIMVSCIEREPLTAKEVKIVKETSLQKKNSRLHAKCSMNKILKCHSGCKKRYFSSKVATNKSTLVANSINVETPTSSQPSKLKKTIGFNFKENCFFCGDAAKFVRTSKTVKKVQLSGFYGTILISLNKECENSKRFQQILVRCPRKLNLVAEKARYHADCFRSFQEFKRSYEKINLKDQIFETIEQLIANNDNEKERLEDLLECANPDNKPFYNIPKLSEKLASGFDHLHFYTTPKGTFMYTDLNDQRLF